MWMKDGNGNWFMTNIDVMPETSSFTNAWDKDQEGNWFIKKKEEIACEKVSQLAPVNSQALSMAC